MYITPISHYHIVMPYGIR